MVKNQKYYFDLDLIRDKIKPESHIRYKGKFSDNYAADSKTAMTHKPRDSEREFHPLGKNPGDVADFWDIPTQSNSDKHYATFNEKLIEKPIVAGCPEGGIILDPFCGTGTTLLRAYDLNRKVIGIDGKKEYVDIASKQLEYKISQLNLF